MRLMLRNDNVVFTCSGMPGPKLDQNGRQKVDRNGTPMWTTQVIAQEKESADVFTVTVAGEKPNVTVGERITLEDLEAIPWANNGKNGVAFRAAKLAPAAAVAAHK